MTAWHGADCNDARVARLVLMRAAIKAPTLSPCGRFVVLRHLHLDRDVYGVLERWAAARGLHTQDAIQLALCTLWDEPGPPEPPFLSKLPRRFYHRASVRYGNRFVESASMADANWRVNIVFKNVAMGLMADARFVGRHGPVDVLYGSYGGVHSLERGQVLVPAVVDECRHRRHSWEHRVRVHAHDEIREGA